MSKQRLFLDRPVSLFGLRGTFAEVARAVTLAERLGFAGVAFGEHHAQKAMDFPDPLVVLAGLAAVTDSITLGTSVSLLPLYHPVEFAERVAVIDQMSGGRVELGVGAGYHSIDFAAFGVPFSRRFRRLQEGIEAVKTLWREPSASFDGEEFSFHDIRLWPRPVQPGGPPVLFSAWSEPGIERAARLGDGWIIDPVQHVSRIVPWRVKYREQAPAGKVVLMRNCVITGADGTFAATCRRNLEDSYSFYLRRGVVDALDPVLTSLDAIGSDHLTEGRVLWGGLDEVAATLTEWVELLQPDEVQLCLSAVPPADLEEQLESYSGLLD